MDSYNRPTFRGVGLATLDEVGGGGGAAGVGEIANVVLVDSSTTVTGGTPDKSHYTFDSVTAPLNSAQVSAPTWAVVDGVDATKLTLDAGTYLVNLKTNASFDTADPTLAVTTFVTKTGLGSTAFFQIGFTANPQTGNSYHAIDADGSVEFVEGYLISVPDTTARRSLRLVTAFNNLVSATGAATVNAFIITKLS